MKPLSDRVQWANKEWSVEAICLAVAVFCSLAFNWTFVGKVIETNSLQGTSGLILGAALTIVATALHLLLFLLLSYRFTVKPVLSLVLLISAAAAYYMSRYTVYLDVDMLRNVLHTDTKESRELMTLPMIGTIALLGGVPALLLWTLRIQKSTLLVAFRRRLIWIIATLVVLAATAFASYQPLSSFLRNHRELRYLVTPSNFMIGLAKVGAGETKRKPRQAIGLDAKLVPQKPGQKPALIVLVVGETVRAQNWRLNGYARQTTPRLKAIGPINFSHVSSCGTATEVSLPCMFSPWGRADFDMDRIKNSQSFLHVLNRVGIDVRWIDNQSGCKGVCEGLPTESIQHVTKATPYCTVEKGCFDRELTERLKAVPRVNGDQFVVLHTLGNHGPSYYARYPASARVFTPECLEDDLGRCTVAQITNSYDNAIVATDAVLADTIAYLQTMTDRDTALIYVSDHGESLGENGLFLHGLPYSIAPQTQKTVPMIMWLSDGIKRDRHINATCLSQRAAQPASHDNLFHSVLGLMGVNTALYRADRDVFASCR